MKALFATLLASIAVTNADELSPAFRTLAPTPPPGWNRWDIFGIHIMRGIPKMAVKENTPVLGTNVRAQDIALTNSTCPWNPDMFGVDATQPGGQAYYDSIFKLYASRGVDYVKVDDISRPYNDVQKAEIEAIRKAIDTSGRPMVLSLSPGATPLSTGPHVRIRCCTARGAT